MNYRIGQAMLGKLPFIDGEMPQYARFYLIVAVKNKQLDVLNVSSVKGKEHKLLYTTNYYLKNYKPPFWRDSFVKLDSLQTIDKTIADRMEVASNGLSLNKEDLNEILSRIKLL